MTRRPPGGGWPTADLDAHIARVRAAYRARRDALLGGLASVLPAGSTHNHPHGGMFVWARLPGDRDATALLARALENHVAYVLGAPFFSAEPDRATLRLSFTAHPPDEIHCGLARLKTALTAA